MVMPPVVLVQLVHGHRLHALAPVAAALLGMLHLLVAKVVVMVRAIFLRHAETVRQIAVRADRQKALFC